MSVIPASASVMDPADIERTYQLHAKEGMPSLSTERRIAERYTCSRQRYVRLVARPDLVSRDASIRDFSMKGLGIVCDRPYELGTTMAIQLRSAHSGLSGILSAQVKRNTQTDDGHWVVGCSLNKRLTDHEALALL